LAVAALIVAIIGLLGCWIPFLGVGLPVVAVGLGIGALVRSRKVGAGKGMAISGLIIGLFALVVAVGISIYSLRFIDCYKGGTTQQEQRQCIEDKVRNG
jgi:hypothetical protein